jgi:hypothetical protein
MMTREDFESRGWKMSYDEFVRCECSDCIKAWNCIHKNAFRRFPTSDDGLGLCSNLSCNWKVREYHKNGINKGNLKREIYFDSGKEARMYVESVFDSKDYALNPTLWNDRNGHWVRETY